MELLMRRMYRAAINSGQAKNEGGNVEEKGACKTQAQDRDILINW
jgi:hypothetical protein